MKIEKSVQKAMELFKVETLRKGQIEPIRSILKGQDTFVIAPPSFGKSLIYQIPAKIHEKQLTLVIEPTVALMHDQVKKLKRLDICAEYIDSTTDLREREEIYRRLRNHAITILYITPERLLKEKFLQAVKNLDIYMIVVDECHCVLEWGISFRPAYYTDIDLFVRSRKKRPIVVALSATVKPKERKHIQYALGMSHAQEFINSIARSNLTFLRMKIPPIQDAEALLEYKLRELHPYIKKYHKTGSMIVYCSTKAHTDAVYNHLSSIYPEQVTRCHSQMKEETRAKHEREFLEGRKTIMVSTSAFGMGIDKGDVDLIIHFDMPFSIGEYYQQAGRAGRDGNKAHCVMFCCDNDIAIGQSVAKKQEEKAQEFMLKQLQEMLVFAKSENCIQQDILAYFGEKDTKTCKHCTNCQRNRRA